MKVILLIIFITLFIFSGNCLAQSEKGDDYIVIGFLNTTIGTNSTDLAEVVEPLINYTYEKTGIKQKLKIYCTLDDMAKDIKEGKLQIGFASNVDYIKLRALFKIIPIARPIKAGSSKYKALLVVRKDSPYKTLADLKNKTYTYSTKDSSHGYIVPSLTIKKKFKIPLEKFFSKTVITKKEVDGILAVYYKKADAVYTNDLVMDYLNNINPRIIRELKIIETSEPMYYGPMFLLPDNYTNKKNIEILKQEFIRMGTNTKGKQVLLLFKISSWETAKDSDYDSIRDLVNKLN